MRHISVVTYKSNGVVHHIKSFAAVVLYVRVDAVKCPQGSNQVFKVKGNSLHSTQSIKKSNGGDCNRVDSQPALTN